MHGWGVRLVGSSGRIFLLSVALGLANAIALLGWSVIDPTNLSWLTGDNATHYLGWAFFRYESSWSFPLAETTRVGYPIGTSIAFLDSVPLVAVVLRPFSRVLPEPFQYLASMPPPASYSSRTSVSGYAIACSREAPASRWWAACSCCSLLR